VVGGDQVDLAGAEAPPEPLTVASLTDRRAALELGGVVGDRGGVEGRVVGAGLGADRHPVAAGGGQRGQGVRGRQVQHVGPGAGGPGGLDDPGHGQVLGLPGPGPEEVGVARPGGRRRPGHRPGVLGMDQQRRLQRGQLGQAALQPRLVEVGELLHPGGEQEALEAEHPGVVEGAQPAQVAGDGAAPEADVDVRLVPGRGALGLQGGHVQGRRDRVERHVDDGGDPAGGRRPGGAGEALPVGPAGLVDVHVGVDQAGQQHLVVGQGDGPPAAEAGRQRLDGGDPAVADGHAGGRLAGRGDHPWRPDGQTTVTCG
jgi:hypothetical protein